MSLKLGIVIPTYNQTSLLTGCIESILQNEDKPQTRIFITNNGGNAEEIGNAIEKAITKKSPEFTIGVTLSHFRENRGFTPALNDSFARAHRASCDVFCLCNDDVVFGPGVIENCIEAVTEHGYGMAHPRSLRGGDLPIDFFQYAANLNKKPISESFSYGGGYTPWCFFVTRDVVDNIGFFDDQFVLWYSDTDYHKRMTAAKVKMCEVGNCLIHHYESRTILSMKDKFEQNGWRDRDAKRFKVKYPEG